MKNGKRSKVISVVGRILLAFLFVFSQSAWAGQDPKGTDNPKPAQKAAVQQASEKQSSAGTVAKTQTKENQAESSEKSSAEEKPGDGKHEGIKVHGHWTIEVKNPNGTLATHREFENSLNASPFLTSVLSRTNTVGMWSVEFGSSTANPCNDSQTGPSPCALVEPSALVRPGLAFPTLAVNSNGNNLVLSGTAIPSLSGSIQFVQTIATLCVPTNPPSTPCGAGTPNQAGAFVFTGANLGTPIQVSAGQTVAVTVVISFS